MQRLRVLATSFLIFLDEKENLIRLFFRISVVTLLIFNIYISMEPLAKGALRGGFFAAGGKGGGSGRPFLA